MNTIFMNYENGKTSDSQRLLLNFTDKIDLRRKYKIYCFIKSWQLLYYTWKNIKNHIRTVNSKYQLQHGMKNLNSLMDHILNQIFEMMLDIN